MTLALLLFWWTGAYNRLVRLRAQGLQAFAVLDDLFRQHTMLLSVHLAALAIAPAVEAQDERWAGSASANAWATLVATVDPFNSALKLAQAQPLNHLKMQPLLDALAALSLAWSQLCDLPPDLAGPALPDSLQLQWAQIAVQIEPARTEFNRSVMNYNEAIGQFPALLLARVFGFKPALPI